MYINDLPTVPESCTLESYVDDSKLFLSFQVKDSLDVATQVNDDLKRVAFWCSQNSLDKSNKHEGPCGWHTANVTASALRF